MIYDDFEKRCRAAGAEKERKRIRRAVGQMLKNLRSLTEWRCRNLAPACGTCGACCTKLCFDRIDAATRARTR